MTKRAIRPFLKFWLPVYLYAGLIFIYSSLSSPPGLSYILYGDKLLHLAEYAILGFLVARALKNSSAPQLRRHFRVYAILFSLVYGLSDEFHQHFVPGRQVEVLDLVADGLGAFFGQLALR
ncbi:MAG: VanZ family protein [Candidatus Omnitrophica bacterium]|nr:VanZ family protein [Candidatus Omnitrophota bacterium]